MDTLSYKTVSATKENAEKKWLLIDAQGVSLGRLASVSAMILRGKHKTNFTPHADCGDYLIIINAEKFQLTGTKMEDKEYISHSGYPGGQKATSVKNLLAKKPFAPVEKAIVGMLPKNKLGRELFRNLYVYVGSEHKQEAQKPTIIDINKIK